MIALQLLAGIIAGTVIVLVILILITIIVVKTRQNSFSVPRTATRFLRNRISFVPRR